MLIYSLSDTRQAGGLLRDLALWQDWSCADRVYQDMMDAKTYSYLRFSALRYLLACPEPRTRARLASLRRHPPEWLTSWPEPFRGGNLP
ncbi:hypothetical protein JST97_19885 [bacterium]|nr:hypothetical protein [bacterium]